MAENPSGNEATILNFVKNKKKDAQVLLQNSAAHVIVSLITQAPLWLPTVNS